MWGRPKRPTFLLPEWICLVLFELIRICVLTVVKAEYPEQFLAEGSPMTDRGWGRERKMYGMLSGIDWGSKIVCLSRRFLGIQVFNLWGSSPTFLHLRKEELLLIRPVMLHLDRFLRLVMPNQSTIIRIRQYSQKGKQHWPLPIAIEKSDQLASLLTWLRNKAIPRLGYSFHREIVKNLPFATLLWPYSIAIWSKVFCRSKRLFYRSCPRKRGREKKTPKLNLRQPLS